MTSVGPCPRVQLPDYDSVPPPQYGFTSGQYAQTDLPPPPKYEQVVYAQYTSSGYIGGLQSSSSSSRQAYVYPPVPYHGNNNNSGNVVVVHVAPRSYQSYCGHIFLACCVAVCCNPLFGIISFVLAMTAHCSSENGDETEARRLGNASIGVSTSGIVITVILIMILFIVTLV